MCWAIPGLGVCAWDTGALISIHAEKKHLAGRVFHGKERAGEHTTPSGP